MYIEQRKKSCRDAENFSRHHVLCEKSWFEWKTFVIAENEISTSFEILFAKKCERRDLYNHVFCNVRDTASMIRIKKSKKSVISYVKNWNRFSTLTNTSRNNWDMMIKVVHLFRSALEVLKMLHDEDWAHRDLKSDNIEVRRLLNYCMLLDFNQCVYFSRKSRAISFKSCENALVSCVEDRIHEV